METGRTLLGNIGSVVTLVAGAILLCLPNAVAFPRGSRNASDAAAYDRNASHPPLPQENDPKEDRHKAIHLASDVLKKFEGKYTPEMPPMALQRLPDMTYTVDGEGLLLDLGNGSPKHRLLPMSETEFFDERVPKARFVFTKSDQGEIKYVTITGALPDPIKANKQPAGKKVE